MDTFIQQYVVPHWPFAVAALVLGILGQFFKTRVWTKKRAASSRIFWWIRAALPLHAAFFGALFGLAASFIFKDFPASMGAHGHGGLMMYYMGAGAVSSWFYNFVDHFMEARGFGAAPASLRTTTAEDTGPNTLPTGGGG